MSDRACYRVLKVLNNNVILARDLSVDQEIVLTGRGIGFHCKVGSEVEIPADKLEKSFVAYDKDIKAKYLQIINKLDGEVLGIGEEIISKAEKELGELDPHIHIALTDHIAFTIDRLKEGMVISNPFLEEIKMLYKEEYNLGIKAALLIKERLNVDIPDTEVGFIALHLHAARQNKMVSETVKYTSLIRQLIEIIEEELSLKIDPVDLDYSRLVNHLRCSIDRLMNEKTVNNPLLQRIKEEFREFFELARKLAFYIEDRMSVVMSEDELGYLALHLHRLKNSKNNK